MSELGLRHACHAKRFGQTGKGWPGAWGVMLTVIASSGFAFPLSHALPALRKRKKAAAVRFRSVLSWCCPNGFDCSVVGNLQPCGEPVTV